MAFRETAFRPARIVVSGMILLALAGCSRKSDEAVVLEKEHIAAAEILQTPLAAPVNSITSPTLAPVSEANDEVEIARDLKDPRALTREQWLVRVQLISGGRKIDVPADRGQYERVKPGDRVRITYREGKYTGTIWSAEIK